MGDNTYENIHKLFAAWVQSLHPEKKINIMSFVKRIDEPFTKFKFAKRHIFCQIQINPGKVQRIVKFHQSGEIWLHCTSLFAKFGPIWSHCMSL